MKKTENNIRVHVYKREGISLKHEFIKELINYLKSDLPIDIEFVETNRVEETDQYQPVLALCLTNSRLGSDALNATKDFDSVSSNMALLVCHHQEIHALPSSDSVTRLTEPSFNGIGGIYDIAFTSEQGLYQCTMNTRAKKDIVDFILRNS